MTAVLSGAYTKRRLPRSGGETLHQTHPPPRRADDRNDDDAEEGRRETNTLFFTISYSIHEDFDPREVGSVFGRGRSDREASEAGEEQIGSFEESNRTINLFPVKHQMRRHARFWRGRRHRERIAAGLGFSSVVIAFTIVNKS